MDLPVYNLQNRYHKEIAGNVRESKINWWWWFLFVFPLKKKKKRQVIHGVAADGRRARGEETSLYVTTLLKRFERVTSIAFLPSVWMSLYATAHARECTPILSPSLSLSLSLSHSRSPLGNITTCWKIRAAANSLACLRGPTNRSLTSAVRENGRYVRNREVDLKKKKIKVRKKEFLFSLIYHQNRCERIFLYIQYVRCVCSCAYVFSIAGVLCCAVLCVVCTLGTFLYASCMCMCMCAWRVRFIRTSKFVV